MVMKIFIGADHRGVAYKSKIKAILKKLGYSVEDVGSFDENQSCDYPRVAYQVASMVSQNKDVRGILVCMSGIGQAMAANKVRGAYAALCYNVEAARLSRQHNNANVLVLSSQFTPESDLPQLIETWMTTDFEGGRHERRVNQIKAIENGEEPD
jgi:RpiB/LacA/LacB family sugar-phosphate isomerase